jgi:trehalose/maltose hydrolase-like predicted phosphorylase
MFIPFHDGVISQFEGYEKLKELDWDRYRRQYGNIQRLDLILEAENDTPNRYKLSKQADVLMLLYVFSGDELRDLFARLGYPLDHELIPRTVNYYDARTSQGSTLGRVVHAWVFARSDRPRSLGYFLEAFQSDTTDIQQGTTKEGVHLGAMGGTVDMAQRVATGIEMTGDVLRFNPQLPEQINRLDMRIRYREHCLDLHLTHTTFIIRSRDTGPPAIRVGIKDAIYELAAGSTLSFSLTERSAA